MNRQLSYVDEHVLVGELGIARVDLDKRALHEVDHRQCVDRREFRVARKRQIQRLKKFKITQRIFIFILYEIFQLL